MAPEITCKECGQQKTHQAFGLCKACYLRQYKARDKDRWAEYHKEYEEKRRGSRIEYNREKSVESYRRHRGKVIQRSKDRYRANPEAKLSKSREWDKGHRAEKHQYFKRWINRKRSNGDVPGLTLKEWKTILVVFNHRCAYCGATDRITQDHVIPLSQGGTDSIENVVPACRSCNSSKGDKTPEEWGKWPIRL